MKAGWGQVRWQIIAAFLIGTQAGRVYLKPEYWLWVGAYALVIVWGAANESFAEKP